MIVKPGRRRRHTAAVVSGGILSIVTSVWFSGCGGGGTHSDQKQARRLEVEDRIGLIKGVDQMAECQAIESEIEAMPPLVASPERGITTTIAMRRRKMELWITLIDKAQGEVDKVLASTKVYMHVPLPAGVRGNAGMEPKYITDSKLRAEYEEAIERNLEGEQLVGNAVELRERVEIWSGLLLDFTRRNYTRSEEDQSELHDLLGKAGHSSIMRVLSDRLTTR